MMQARRSSLYRKVGAGAPTILVRDTFTDSNGTLLVNHTPDIDTVGNGWIELLNANRFDISSNRARQAGSTAGISLIAIDAGTADCVISVGSLTCSKGTTVKTMALIGRVLDSNNYLMVGTWTYGTNPWTWAIREVQGGSSIKNAQVQGITGGNASIDVAATFTVNGTSVRFEVPEENIDVTMELTSPTTATKHGLYANSNSINSPAGYVDDFEITTP